MHASPGTGLRFAAALILALALTGWGPCSRELIKVDPPPKIVEVAVKTPVSLCPEGGAECALLRDCYNEKPKEQSYAEAKRLANLRDASIEDDCNKRWAKVRALQPKEKP